MPRPQEDHADRGLVSDSDHAEAMCRSAPESSRCTLRAGTGGRAGRITVVACTHPKPFG